MRFYEVTNKELAKEVKEQVERLVEITNKFLEVSVSYGFDGLAMDSVGLSSDIADVFCRGFYANTNNLTTEQKRKFKLVSKGRVAVPKKAYEAEVKTALGDLDFNHCYDMVETWNKFVKKGMYAEQSGGFVFEGVHGAHIDGENVYLAIMAKREQANLNTKALQEIKESEYLKLKGK